MTTLSIMASYTFVMGILALSTFCFGSVAYGVAKETFDIISGKEKLV